MTAEEIISRAAADRVVVRVSDNGKLQAKGEDDAIGRWLPLLRQHKTEITKLLLEGQGAAAKTTNPLPTFCQADCSGLEFTRPGIPLPEWCSSHCEDFSETALPNGQIMWKCWSRQLGRNSGLLHTMSGCPRGHRGKRK
jgi:hypothetical protein